MAGVENGSRGSKCVVATGWGSRYVGWGSKWVETGLQGFKNGCWGSKWNARELRRVSGGSKMRVGRYKRVVVSVNG